MPFCTECGNNLPETAKFCNECGTKQETKTVVQEKKVKKKIAKTSIKKTKTPTLEPVNETENHAVTKIQDAEMIDDKKTEISKKFTGKIDSKDTDKLKEFFTKPKIPETEINTDTPGGWYAAGCMFILFGFLLIGPFSETEECVEYDRWGWCEEYETTTDESCVMMGVVLFFVSIAFFIQGGNVGTKQKEDEEKLKKWTNEVENWRKMDATILMKRLDQCQTIAAESSYQALGINKNAKPNEGGTIRQPAYSYGPHLEFNDMMSAASSSFIDLFTRIDDDGVGKGAGYYKNCEHQDTAGLYTREYDMMVVHFTVNQILVYKCVFDVLEMTKRLEESYEWSYKHVVGINISGDDKEKKLGDSMSITGTKYMVISAASGDKIEIILGAETNELVDGEKKKSHIGAEDKIFEVANAAIANVRQAIRDKAD